MNKILAILFLAILLILIQNKTTPLALASFTRGENDSDHKIASATAQFNNHHDDQNENDSEDDEDGGNKKIAIIPGSSTSANLNFKLKEHLLPSTTPTPIAAGATVLSATPIPTPIVSNDNSQTPNIQESFDLIRELEKLLSSLKKIIFNTIS